MPGRPRNVEKLRKNNAKPTVSPETDASRTCAAGCGPNKCWRSCASVAITSEESFSAAARPRINSRSRGTSATVAGRISMFVESAMKLLCQLDFRLAPLPQKMSPAPHSLLIRLTSASGHEIKRIASVAEPAPHTPEHFAALLLLAGGRILGAGILRVALAAGAGL